MSITELSADEFVLSSELPNPPIVDLTVGEFSGMTDDMSSSCDLMGTLGTLVNEITQTIRDKVTGAVTTVKRAATDVMNDMKSKMSEMFGESGGTLSKIKGYITKAKNFIEDINQKIRNYVASAKAAATETLAEARAKLAGFVEEANNKLAVLRTKIANVAATIRGAIDGVRNAIGKLTNLVTDCVKGLKQATCSTISTFLAGSAPDALSNLTGAGADATLANIGTNKQAFENGAESMADVTTALAKNNNVDGIASDSASAFEDGVDAVSGTASEVTTIGSEFDSLIDHYRNTTLQ